MMVDQRSQNISERTISDDAINILEDESTTLDVVGEVEPSQYLSPESAIKRAGAFLKEKTKGKLSEETGSAH